MGELEQARVLLLEARENADEEYLLGVELELATLALLEGDADGARARGEALCASLNDLLDGELWRIRALALAGQAALVLGDKSGARAVLARAQAVAARVSPPPGGEPHRALADLEAALTD